MTEKAAPAKKPARKPRSKARKDRKEMKAIATAAADQILAGKALEYAPPNPLLQILDQWEITRPSAPEVGTIEARRAVIEMTIAGIPRERIADYLGTTLDKLIWFHGFELKTATDEIVGRVAMSMVQRALAGDVVAMTSFLKSRGGDAWREKKTVEMTGKDGGAISVEVKEKMVDKLLDLVRNKDPDLIDVTPTQKP